MGRTREAATSEQRPTSERGGSADKAPRKGSAKGAPKQTALKEATPKPSAPDASASRTCPTRVGGGVPLFQHQVTVAQCQSKQRGLYHKCFTCAHANGR